MLSWRGLILGDGNFWGSGLQPLSGSASLQLFSRKAFNRRDAISSSEFTLSEDTTSMRTRLPSRSSNGTSWSCLSPSLEKTTHDPLSTRLSPPASGNSLDTFPGLSSSGISRTVIEAKTLTSLRPGASPAAIAPALRPSSAASVKLDIVVFMAIFLAKGRQLLGLDFFAISVAPRFRVTGRGIWYLGNMPLIQNG